MESKLGLLSLEVAMGDVPVLYLAKLLYSTMIMYRASGSADHKNLVLNIFSGCSIVQ